MFDLENEMEGWRREMAAAGLSPDVLLELEEHLREDIERETHSGASESKAFRLALRRIGKPSALRNEFDLIEPAGLGETLRRHRWKLVLCLGLGLAAAVAVQIFRPAPYLSEAKLLIRSVIADRRLIVRAPVSDIEVA